MNEFDICREITLTGMFDAQYYLDCNPDVRESGIDPLLHYVRYGEKEGRNPSAKIDLTEIGNAGGGLALLYLAGRISVKKPVAVVFCANNNYWDFVSVAIASIKTHCQPDRQYSIYLLHNDVPAQKIERMLELTGKNFRILPILVNPVADKTFRKGFTSNHITHEAYFRFLIPSQFPATDKVLYLDCDLVAQEDIGTLYDQDVDDYAFGAIHEIILNNDYHKQMAASLPGGFLDDYYSSGVMLINSKLCREQKLFETCLAEMASGRKWLSHDQGILNMVCKGRIKRLDMKWNLLWHKSHAGRLALMQENDKEEYLMSFGGPAIIHYASDRKPWNYNDGHFTSIWWQYAANSPFFTELKEAYPFFRELEQ